MSKPNSELITKRSELSRTMSFTEMDTNLEQLKLVIDQSNDNLDIRLRQNVKRQAAEAGFNLVDGSFEEGANISGWPDVVWCQTDGKYYQWKTDESKTVTAGSTPTNIGTDWIDKSSATLSGILSNRPIIYAHEHGVIDSSTVDSADALQALVDANPTAKIITRSFALSHSIKYPSYCDISGFNSDQSFCFLLPGFTSDHGAAFEPVNTSRSGVLLPKITNLVFVDNSASNDGKGTNSVLNGVELLGTFRAQVGNLRGIRMNAVVHCEQGDCSVAQYTRRPYLYNLDGSNINWLSALFI